MMRLAVVMYYTLIVVLLCLSSSIPLSHAIARMTIQLPSNEVPDLSNIKNKSLPLSAEKMKGNNSSNLELEDTKRLVPTGPNPLHNRQLTAAIKLINIYNLDDIRLQCQFKSKAIDGSHARAVVYVNDQIKGNSHLFSPAQLSY